MTALVTSCRRIAESDGAGVNTAETVVESAQALGNTGETFAELAQGRAYPLGPLRPVGSGAADVGSRPGVDRVGAYRRRIEG